MNFCILLIYYNNLNKICLITKHFFIDKNRQKELQDWLNKYNELDEKYKSEKKELNDYVMELENKVAILA